MITHAQLNKALKTLYIGQKMRKVVYGKPSRVFMNNVRKNKEFAGDTMPIPIQYGQAYNRSRSFTIAQGGSGAPGIAKFNVDVFENHQIATISTQSMLRTRKDAGSFITHAELKIDQHLNILANDTERQIFSEQSSWLGRVQNTSFATAVLTLTDAKHAKRFEVGMQVVFGATKTGALRDSADFLTVVAVDFAGNVTLDANLSNIAAIAQNDYVFARGDAANAGSLVAFPGIPDFLPATAPVVGGGDSLFGLDRSAHPTRLAGNRVSGNLSDIVKALRDGATAIADVSDGIPDKAYCSYTTWGQAVDQLDADVLRAPSAEGLAGYQYINVYGPRGLIELVPATFCEENVIWLLQQDTWELVSAGEPIRINDDDGLMARAKYNEPGLEVRGDSHAALVCVAPGNNCRVTLV